MCRLVRLDFGVKRVKRPTGAGSRRDKTPPVEL